MMKEFDAGARKMARWADRYQTRLSMPLVAVPPGGKGPRAKDWQRKEHGLLDAAHWHRNPRDGIAVVLEHAGLVSLDIDDAAHATAVLTHFGLDLQEMQRAYPTIQSRPGRCRIMFSKPANTELRPRALRFPQEDDPRRHFVVLELRARLLADTLPPSTHPSTGQPYTWSTPPRDGFPELPDRLLELWHDWDYTERTALSLCPWYVPPAPKPARAQSSRDPNKPSVIAEFNKVNNVVSLLEQHGYERRGKRFSKPKTSHAAGFVLLDEGHIFCHHAGDVLGDRKPHDAFDLFAQFEYGGDCRAAVRAAAKLLGLGERR